MPTHPLFHPSLPLKCSSPPLSAFSNRRSLNPAPRSLPRARLPVNPGFRIPNLRGRSLRFSLIAASTAIISVDILHTHSHSLNDQLNLAVPDALASTAATVVFCTALENQRNPSKRKFGSNLATHIEHDESDMPLIEGPARCQTLFQNTFEQAAVEVGVTGFVVCQGSDILFAKGDVRQGVGAGGVVERVQQVHRAIYMGTLPVMDAIPFGRRVAVAYFVPVGGLVVGFGSARRLSVGQRRYLRALAEDLL